MSRKRYLPTPDDYGYVERMIACRIPLKMCMRIMGLANYTVFRRVYQAQIETGKAKADFNVASAFMKNATSECGSAPSVMAQIFYLKNHPDWQPDAIPQEATRSISQSQADAIFDEWRNHGGRILDLPRLPATIEGEATEVT